MTCKLIAMLLLLTTLKAIGQNSDTSDLRRQKKLIDYDSRRPVIKIEEPLLKNENGLLRYSALSGYRQGQEPTTGTGNFESVVDIQHHVARIYMINLSIQDLLTGGYYKNGDIVLEVKDPSKYRYDPSKGVYKEWIYNNGYCFEFMIPYGLDIDISELIKNEVSHYFGVVCKDEKRVVDALVLIRTSDIDKIKSAGIGVGHYDMKGLFTNVPLDRLAHPLAEADLPPMVNETGYKGNVDLDLKLTSWKDLSALRKELQRYDLDLKLEKRPISKFVIHEIK